MKTVRVTQRMAKQMLAWLQEVGIVEFDDTHTTEDLAAVADGRETARREPDWGDVATVQKSKTTQVVGESELIADASDIGLAPGEWPAAISVVDDERECHLFERGSSRTHNGELVAMTYRTRDGLIELTVLND